MRAALVLALVVLAGLAGCSDGGAEPEPTPTATPAPTPPPPPPEPTPPVPPPTLFDALQDMVPYSSRLYAVGLAEWGPDATQAWTYSIRDAVARFSQHTGVDPVNRTATIEFGATEPAQLPILELSFEDLNATVRRAAEHPGWFWDNVTTEGPREAAALWLTRDAAHGARWLVALRVAGATQALWFSLNGTLLPDTGAAALVKPMTFQAAAALAAAYADQEYNGEELVQVLAGDRVEGGFVQASPLDPGRRGGVALSPPDLQVADGLATGWAFTYRTGTTLHTVSVLADGTVLDAGTHRESGTPAVALPAGLKGPEKASASLPAKEPTAYHLHMVGSVPVWDLSPLPPQEGAGESYLRADARNGEVLQCWYPTHCGKVVTSRAPEPEP